jgi:hypothetical protein
VDVFSVPGAFSRSINQEGTAVDVALACGFCTKGAVVLHEPGTEVISDLIWMVSTNGTLKFFVASDDNGVFDNTVPISSLGSSLAILATLDENGLPQDVGQFFGLPTNVIFFQSDVDAAATPLPAALPLFAAGLGALGLLGRRRKRKDAAVEA